MKILVSAYACRPHHGSEQGAGWEWVKQIARFHTVWILTSETNRSAIKTEQLNNAEFIFLRVGSFVWLKRLGLLGHYVYYYLWHYAAYRRARSLHEKVKFDIVHQITFGTFRIPAFVCKLPIPSVWGPIGGGEYIPARFLPVLGRRAFGEIFRTVTNPLALWIPGVRTSLRRAAVVLTVNKATLEFLPNRYRAKYQVVPIVGEKATKRKMRQEGEQEHDNQVHLLFVGKLEARRSLVLLLKALRQLVSRVDFNFRVVGDGPERPRYEKLAKKYGLSERVTFVGKIPFKAVYEEYARARILCSSSLRDSGGSTYVGAMASGVPIVCIDHSGPGELVTKECGVKVSPHSLGQVVNDLADAIEKLANNQDLRQKMGLAGRQRVKETFDWDIKGAELMRIYNGIYFKSRETALNRRWHLRGEGGANWKYLLSINDRSRVLSMELPHPDAIASLARSVREVVIACRTHQECNELTEELAKRGLQNVSAMLVSRLEALTTLERYDVVLASAYNLQNMNTTFEVIKSDSTSMAIEANSRGLLGFDLKASRLGYKRVAPYIPFPSAHNFCLLVSSASNKVARRSFLLHNTMKFRNRIKKSIAVVLSSVGLLSVAVPCRFYVLTKVGRDDTSILLGFLKRKYPSEEIYLALHPGSHGKSNKAVVQVMNSKGDILAYAKVADNSEARAYLMNERETLSYLAQLSFEKGEIPSVIDYTEKDRHTILLLSVPQTMGRISPINIQAKHLDWLRELSEKTEIKDRYVSSNFFASEREGLKRAVEAQVFSRPEQAAEFFEGALAEISEARLPYSLAQRDFTAWNVRVLGDKIFVLDWEWARRDFPPLQDLFHFGYQASLRVKGLDSIRSVRRLFFQPNPFTKKVRLFCKSVGIDPGIAYSLFVFYAFDWLVRGVEIGSRVIINEQAALINALITRSELSRHNFLAP